MNLPQLLTFLTLGTAPVQAAISILVEPGVPGTSIFTVTETAPNPLLNVANVSGYVLGMDLPTSMFNIPGLGGGSSSDIEGDLTSSIATITEVFSNQSFLFKHLVVSADSGPSILYFDPIFLIGGVGPTSLQFEVTSLGPVATNIGFEALNAGVHSVDSTIFGSVMVTVVPEPSSAILIAAAAIPLLSRRRRAR